MRSLVIFYSKSGMTYTVANTINKILNSHTKEIIDYDNHKPIHEYLFPKIFNDSKINPEKIDIDYYETIFIGSPIWLGSITPAIRKFIENMNFKNKNIILFTTQKGFGTETAIKNFCKLIKKHDGKIKGCFAINTNCNKQEIERYTYQAIKDLDLIEN